MIVVFATSREAADRALPFLPEPVLTGTSKKADRRYLFYQAHEYCDFREVVEAHYFDTIREAFDWMVEDSHQRRMILAYKGVPN